MKATSQFAINRRAFLGGSTGALGMMAMSRLLGGEAARPHHRARAKSVICLFQHGGPSQVDLFDPKPELNRRHGKKYDGDIEAHFEKQMGNCLASPYGFKRRGQAGIELSELLPHTAGIADDLTLVRSMTTGSVDHESALRLIHSGKFIAGWPAWGSWVIYGLGSANRNLPSYVVLADPGGLPVDGVRNWSSGWLPAVYQGVAFRAGKSPVPNLTTPKDITPGAHAGRLDFLQKLNRAHQRRFPDNTELAARIANYETAARMQTAVPDVLDLSRESAATRKFYGLDHATTREYGSRCLMARRLVESGVRFRAAFFKRPAVGHARAKCRQAEGTLRAHRPAQRRARAGPRGARPA